MKYLGIILSLAAFVLMASCALATLIEEKRKAKVKRASERYARRHRTAV